MALAPRFSGLKLFAGSTSATVHSLELYLDYVCPFSKKLFDTLYKSVQDTVKTKYSSKIAIIFRPQIQPWHPSSTLVHEAGASVLRIAPSEFWKFSAVLFDHQTEYFDVNVVNETRNDTYRRLSRLAATVGIDEAKIYNLLAVPDKADAHGGLNIGNEVTDDVKYMVKANRQLGIHVTPTVLFDGVVENNISSSFTVQQWEDWLQKNVV